MIGAIGENALIVSHCVFEFAEGDLGVLRGEGF
jgi:hypothetical protein